MYFNVNFNVFLKLIIVHFLVSQLYIYLKMHGATIKKPGYEVATKQGHPFFREPIEETKSP